jgi:hypothetical protein
MGSRAPARVSFDHGIGVERPVLGVLSRESARQLGLEPVKGLGLGTLFVAADQVTHVFARLLIVGLKTIMYQTIDLLEPRRATLSQWREVCIGGTG